MIKILYLVIPPYGKTRKLKNVNQLILMNVQIIVLVDPFLLKEYNLLAKILRDLLSNKNGILHI